MDADDYNLKWNNFETGITRNSYGILWPLLQEIEFYFFCICIFKAKKIYVYRYRLILLNVF